MKLYYGGFGDYKTFTVAEDEQKAIESIGKKINAPFLPVTVEEISEVDGFAIVPGREGVVVSKMEAATDEPDKPITDEVVELNKIEEPEASPEIKLRHCKTCGMGFENQGDLMRHCREEHPKGD